MSQPKQTSFEKAKICLSESLSIFSDAVDELFPTKERIQIAVEIKLPNEKAFQMGITSVSMPKRRKPLKSKKR